MKVQPGALLNFRKDLERFINVSDEEMKHIATFFTYRKLRKNDLVVREGEKVKHTYWIIKGLLISGFTDPKGKEHIIQFAQEDCWITDQKAFYNQERAILNIGCVEDSELLCLSYENREKLCAEMHKMEKFFRKRANDSFVKQQARLLTYLTSDAKKRYELLVEEYPSIIQRLSKKTLAAYLGVSRETMSRFGK